MEHDADETKEMSFWDHLDELRVRLVRIVLAILAMAIIAFINRQVVFDLIILGPSKADFITNKWLCALGELLNIDGLCFSNLKIQIININMSGQFLVHLYTSAVAGVVLAFPYIIYQFWGFVRPALHAGEKKKSRQAIFYSSLLFASGLLFGYFLIVPLTINFLGTYQVSSSVSNQIALNSFISTVVSVSFAVGIVFQLPLLIYFLAKAGLVSPDYLKRNRKYMLVILLIVSAIITPPDIFSQIMVCIPLIGLYEISIGIARRAYKEV
ncbi:MAG TPA: twin-arginine translocase subunit TatC [Bacteroidales bacterium]|nr:twin-arginine translocase subunit TatC [Bacteroidales bacterium]